jgi:hypothetical protein
MNSKTIYRLLVGEIPVLLAVVGVLSAVLLNMAVPDEKPQRKVLPPPTVPRATEYDSNNYLFWEALGRARITLADEPGARTAFSRMHALRAWKKPPALNWRNY